MEIGVDVNDLCIIFDAQIEPLERSDLSKVTFVNLKIRLLEFHTFVGDGGDHETATSLRGQQHFDEALQTCQRP